MLCYSGLKRVIKNSGLATLAFLLATGTLMAQTGEFEIKGGRDLVDVIIRAGVSFPKQPTKLKDPELKPMKNKILVGFHTGVGILVAIPQVPGLSMEFTTVFDRKGTQFTNTLGSSLTSPIESSDPEVMVTRDAYYINFPIHLVYSVEMMRTGIFVSAGPTLSCGLFGHTKFKGGTEQAAVFNDLNALKRFDVSIGARMGFRLLGIELSGFYDAGLLDISSKGHVNIQNGVGGLSLGYLF